jgi:hypothetical protein
LTYFRQRRCVHHFGCLGSSKVRDKEVLGLTYCEVRSAAELLSLVRKANINRAVRHTAMNTHSSRSHGILQLAVEQKDAGKIVKSKLSLVDLAGSERWDEKDTSAGEAAATYPC